MRTTRVYVDLELSSDREILLPIAQSTHLLRVLRLRVGAALTLFNGRGGEYMAELIGSSKAGARLLVRAHSPVERESPLTVTLLQGMARGDRMDVIVQKATELGVTRIVPLSCEFSVVRLDVSTRQRRTQHWRAVAVAACEQCGRNRVPEVAAIGDLADACRTSNAQLRLMLLPQAPESLAGLAGSPSSASLLIGPEGGLSGREQLLAQSCGFRPCRLGPRILRTETAPLAALAALQAMAGDLR
jgi:16S rRNA (uracil1498-N3)-methyltransferase